VGVNTKDPQYHLDLSGNARITGNVTASLDVSLNRNVKLGSGSNSIAVNKDISSAFALDISGATSIRNGPLFVSSDVSLNSKLFVQGDASLNRNLFIGQDISINRFLYVASRSVLNGDASLNQNVKLGSGSNSIAVNKDTNSAYALDVSGTTNFSNGPLFVSTDVSLNSKLFVQGDASFNQNLYIGQDVSINRLLYVNNAALFNGDISTNQNLYVAGKATFGRPPAATATYELDVSGQMRIYEEIGSNVTSNTSVATLTLEHADASGASSIMFKSPSTTSNGDYAYIKYQDLSGATTNAGLLTIGIENDPTVTTTKDMISLYAAGGSGYVGVNTLNPAFNLDVSGGFRTSGDASINVFNFYRSISGNPTLRINNTEMITLASNDVRFGNATTSGNMSLAGNQNTGSLYIGHVQTSGNLFIGSGNTDRTGVIVIGGPTNKNTIGNVSITGSTIDSSNNLLQFVPDASFGKNMFVSRDVSINTNLYVGQDVSINSNLYVANRTVLNNDVSMNQNARLGAGNNSVAINKDISSNFALDVSGETNFRGVVNTLSDLSVNGRLFTSGDVSLNQKLFVQGDASFNRNLSVGQDVSINRNLDISGTLRTRQIEPFDPTLTGGLIIGSTLVGPSGSVKIGTTAASTYVDIGNTTINGGTFRFNQNGLITGNTTALSMSFADNIQTGNVSVGPSLTTGNLIIGSQSTVNHAGNISIGNASGRTGAIIIGGHNSSSTTYVNAGSVRVKDQGNGTFYVGRIPGDGTATDAVSVALAGGVNTTGSVRIMDGSGSTGTAIIGRNNAIRIVNSATTTVDVSATGLLTLRGSNLNVIGATLFNSDVSMNQNLDIGSGNNSVAINKDISSNFALDVSGATNLRGVVSTLSDISVNGRLFTSGDVSLNQKLFVNLDASFNRNLYIGQDVSINRSLYVANAALFNSDISTNQNLYVAGNATFGRPPVSGTTYELDLSGQMRIYEFVGSDVTSNASVATLTLEHGDASGCSSIMFKSPSTTSNGDYAYIKYQDKSHSSQLAVWVVSA